MIKRDFKGFLRILGDFMGIHLGDFKGFYGIVREFKAV